MLSRYTRSYEQYGWEGNHDVDAANLPLDGVRVLELGHIVAGPSAGLILADLGAEVIKVEHPTTGDAARSMPNQGSTFYYLNRNKASVGLDLKHPEGRAIFERLVAVSDVVVENFAPGALERLGLDWNWARTINPRIIYCSIRGFLPGPYAGRPFLDELAQMAGGLAFMTGPPGQPLRAGASIVDIGAATYGVVAILAALWERERTGRGQAVQAGLFETVAFWVGQHVARYQLAGIRPEPVPARGVGGMMGWGVYRLFDTQDGRRIFVAVTSNRHWRGLCTAFGWTDWLQDPALSTNRRRVAQRSRIEARLEPAMAALSFEEASRRLAEAGVPYAPVNSPADLLDDPQLKSPGRLLPVPGPDGRPVSVPALPIAWLDRRFSVRAAPPRLGQDSETILRQLGFSSAEIARWKASGVVGEGPWLLEDEAQGKKGESRDE